MKGGRASSGATAGAGVSDTDGGEGGFDSAAVAGGARSVIDKHNRIRIVLPDMIRPFAGWPEVNKTLNYRKNKVLKPIIAEKFFAINLYSAVAATGSQALTSRGNRFKKQALFPGTTPSTKLSDVTAHGILA